MSYFAGISGGSNLYDMLRYRQAQADQQAGASGNLSNFFQSARSASTSTSSGSTSPTSTTSGSGSAASATQSGAATAGPGSAASLTSELTNLLMEFQQVLGQMGQELNGAQGGAASTAATAGSPAGTDAAPAGDAASTASASDPSQQAAATAAAPPHRHHRHHHQESQSSSASGENSSSAAASDPLAQLLATTAGTSGTTTGKSAFEQAFASGENTAGTDKLFSKIDKNSDGTIDQSEAQNALKHLQQPWNTAGMQSPSGTQTGGQGNSSQRSWLSGSNLLLMAQQMGQAA